MKIIQADDAGFAEFFHKLRQRGGGFSAKLLVTVADIISEVSVKGDEALFDYTAKFDGYQLSAATVEVTAEEKNEALALVAPVDLEVIKLAARRIEDYHRHQITQGFMVKNVTAKIKERLLVNLNGEVETYDQYLTGDIYGFKEVDSEGNEVDSCWGFYGDFETSGIIEEAKEMIK